MKIQFKFLAGTAIVCVGMASFAIICLSHRRFQQGAAAPQRSNAPSNVAAATPNDEGGRDKSRGVEHESKRLLDELFKIGMHDLASALRRIDEDVPSIERSAVRFDLMLHLCKQNPGFLEQIENVLLREQCRPLIEGSVKSWAMHDNDIAVADLISSINLLKDPGLRLLALSDLTRRLSGNDRVHDARVFLESMPPGGVRRGAVASFVYQTSVKHPEQSIEFVESLTDKGETIASYEALVDSFKGKKDVASLNRLAQTGNADVLPMIWSGIGHLLGPSGDISDLDNYGTLQGKAKSALFLGFMGTAPPAKLDSLISTAMSSGEQNLMIKAGTLYIRRLTEADPASMTRWVLSSPGSIRKDMLGAFVNKWSEVDKGATVSWVENLPPGTDKDFALEAMAKSLQWKDAAAARRIAEKIGDPNRRAITLKYIPE